MHQAHILAFACENNKDLGLLLFGCRIWVVCAVVRTLLFTTSLRIQRVFICTWQRWGPAPRQAAGDEADVRQAEFYKPVSLVLSSRCSPSLLTKNINLQGRTEAVRQRIGSALRGHPLLCRVLLSCVYVIASVTTAVFPMLRLALWVSQIHSGAVLSPAAGCGADVGPSR